jgi:Leucine-rich repeat (LRR) protein
MIPLQENRREDMSSSQQGIKGTMSSRIRTVLFLVGIIFLNLSVINALAFQCADVTEISISECEALQDLYNSTDGANWQDNTGWLVSNTPCSWFGIVCDGSGKLTEIHLQENKLQGQLPETIGYLSDLEYLNVSDNELTGAVPNSIGFLANLTGLWVGGNQITSLPGFIGNCSQLTHLDLRKNQISSLPSRIGELTGLTYLTLHTNQLTASSIPAGFANLSLLTTLSFQSNQLTSLPAPVSEMTNLKSLDLSGNKPMDSLEGIGNLTGLETLHLYLTELTELPEEVASLTNLKELRLDNNSLTHFPSVLTELTSLETLLLTYNPQMGGSLPSSLVNLTQMTEFAFDGTELCVPDDAGLQAWLDGIATLTSSGKECGAGTVELEKSVSIMRMLTGHEGTCTDLDVDGDGKVGSNDAVLSLKKAVGVDGEQAAFQLSLMVATSTDSLDLAWFPASHDGGSINYNIHLSEQEDFTPGPTTLKKTVAGSTQAEISGLEADKLYYAVIVAVHSDNSEESSNVLQAKTFQSAVTPDGASVVVQAKDFGLGKYTTDDDITYIFATGTLPEPGNILIAENVAGGTTLRRVVSATKLSDGTVSIVTADASLTDVFDSGSIYSSMKLVDVVQQEGVAQDSMSKNTASGSLSTIQNEDRSSKIEWKNDLLSAEQINFSYQEGELSVTPQGSSSVIAYDASSSQQFTASVTAKFEPTLITEAEWGGYIVKELRHAKIAAKGTLSLEALAEYNFSASGQWEKDWQLWKKTWTSVYLLGPSGIPVYQEITLKMDAKVFAHASSEIKAQARAGISKSMEIGATFDGYKWTPFVTPDDQTSFTASMDIVGKGSASIRLVPSIEVRFYKVASASLTAEPSVYSYLWAGETTNNTDFLAAHPDRLLQITRFGISYYFNSYLSITLGGLGMSWDVLSPTCMIGTGSDCLYQFDSVSLLSLPEFSLEQADTVNNERILELTVIDGTNNTFSPDSVEWEAFPGDASIIPKECTKTGKESTCKAVFIPGKEDEYTVFASGHGILGEIGRQFDEVTIDTDWSLGIIHKSYLAPCYSDGYANAWIVTGTSRPIITDFSVVIRCTHFKRDDDFPFDCNQAHDQDYFRNISLGSGEYPATEYPITIPHNGDCPIHCFIESNTGGYDGGGVFVCSPEGN